MPTKLVRLNLPDQLTLKELSRRAGVSMQEILHKAIEHYRREYLLMQTNAAYANLKSEDNLSKEQQQWDISTFDGIEEK